MTRKQKPVQIENLMQTIKTCIEERRFRQVVHALAQERESEIDLLDTLYVLKTGYHEKRKTSFNDAFQAWNYAIRGKTLENTDIRIIVAFDENEMMIITVMHVTKDTGKL